MKLFIRNLLSICLLIFLLATFPALAQPVLPDPPEQAPIDFGLGILGALGAAYGIKKLRNRTN